MPANLYNCCTGADMPCCDGVMGIDKLTVTVYNEGGCPCGAGATVRLTKTGPNTWGGTGPLGTCDQRPSCDMELVLTCGGGGTCDGFSLTDNSGTISVAEQLSCVCGPDEDFNVTFRGTGGLCCEDSAMSVLHVVVTE